MTDPSMLSKAANEFLTIYPDLIDGYEKVAKLCTNRCTSLLREAGIMTITSFRAKGTERLRDKLVKRTSEGHVYDSRDDVLADIVDLAGVRIALYYPGDVEEVSTIIRKHFIIQKEVVIPSGESEYNNRILGGYKARHYRVYLKKEYLDEKDIERGYDKKMIEIQVATVLMHVWSEVEHDLVYKPLKGELSDMEKDALTQLNSLMCAGELSLVQLERGMRARASTPGQEFRNPYDLAAYIYRRLEIKYGEIPREMLMGSVEELLEFLTRISKQYPEGIEGYVDSVDLSYQASVVLQIVHQIIDEDESLNETYVEARRHVGRWRIDELKSSSVIKGSLPMLYWYGADEKRYAFPNIQTLWTWFPPEQSQPRVRQLSDVEVAKIPIGGNITYRPGTRLIKITTDPKIYAVSGPRALRWVTSSEIAEALFGKDWYSLVDIIPDAFFTNYTIGKDIRSVDDYSVKKELMLNPSVDLNLGLKK